MTLIQGGPATTLSGGEADARGVIYAAAVQAVGSEVNLVPASLKPGSYLVTAEGSANTKAYYTLEITPAPTPVPPTATPAAKK